jgi:hypothetical protein
MSSHFIQLGTTFWIAAIANGGGGGARSKGFHVKDTAMMKVEVFVKKIGGQGSQMPSL